MSSDRFVTELVPDERVRRCLLGTGCTATLAGGVLIIGMPLIPAFKVALAILWLLSGIVEVRAMIRGMSRLRRIRVRPEGLVEGVAPDGRVEPVVLLPGSMVLARVAWLRIGFGDGCRYGELVTGNARRSDEWRLFQLIWRQRSSIFGRPEGS